MARQERAEVTRQSILLAAAQAFDEQGYLGTTMNSVVERAGVTKGAAYFHFASKEALAAQLVREMYDSWPPLVAEFRRRGRPALETLVELSVEVGRRYRDNVLTRAGVQLAYERELDGAQLPTPYLGWMRLVAELLQEAREEGDVHADVDVQGAAWVIVAAFFGIQQVSDVLTARADIERRLQYFWELVLVGLQAPALSSRSTSGDISHHVALFSDVARAPAPAAGRGGA